MFLAATALTEFWDKSQELLYLGLWCLPREKVSEWDGARGKVMASPWDEPGRSDLLPRQSGEDVPDRLVDFLGATLNEILGVSRSPRYWRILLKPWALAHVAVVTDHWLHLDAAFRKNPGLETWLLDAQDFVVPNDTSDHRNRLNDDSYHLQLYTELLTGMGKKFPAKRLSGPAKKTPAPRTPRGLNGLAREVLRGAARGLRSIEVPKAYFSGSELDDKESWSLIKLSKGRVMPIAEHFPENLAFAPEASRRHRLANFPAHGDLDRLIARTLPTHFPTLFLEGYHQWHQYVLSRWTRAPLRLLAGQDILRDEYLKMLAAEGVERGGRVAVYQDDGGGLQDPGPDERHERATFDQYWTWGWSEAQAKGAPFKPMPDPRGNRTPRRKKGKTAAETALVGTSLPRYPYATGFDHMPAWHRFYDYLKERERFVAALPQWVRDALVLHLDAPDLGWGHKERLAAKYPTLRCETAPWHERLDSIRFLIIDNPLRSPARALALNIPTLLFWNPALWKSRPAAGPALDALRAGGLLFDNPEAAANKTASVLKNPLAWWQGSEPQKARAQFCRLYAHSDPDWAKLWIKAAQEI